MDPFTYWTAVTLGSIHGALYDPLIWGMIGIMALIALSSMFRWWMPAALALVFNVIHVVNVLPFWTRILGRHDTWMQHAAWQLVVKLIIAYAVALVVAGLVRVVSQGRSAA